MVIRGHKIPDWVSSALVSLVFAAGGAFIIGTRAAAVNEHRLASLESGATTMVTRDRYDADQINTKILLESIASQVKEVREIQLEIYRTATGNPYPEAPRPKNSSALSPQDAYHRGVRLWNSDRTKAFTMFQVAADGGVVDAHFYLGLYYVDKKDISTLKRAEVVAALRHFQEAKKGEHSEFAAKYVGQLEKEYDKVRQQ